MRVRRVEARVEVDGKTRAMVFITNNLEWSPAPVCDLDRSRRDTGVFSKRIKRTLKPSGFPGHGANAVRRRIRPALLVHVLLRYLTFLSGWRHSFTRIFTVVRPVLRGRFNLSVLLESHGTAPDRLRVTGALNQAWLPGLAP